MNSPNIQNFILISVIFAGLAFLIISLYLLYEKKKKQKLKDRFRKFSKDFHGEQKEMRGAKRVFVPESLDIELSFNTDDSSSNLEGTITNLSLSGFAIIPDFPLRKLPSGETIVDVKIKTPISEYSISKIKNIRLEHDINKRLLGFRIIEIGDVEFKTHKSLLLHLEEFIENESQ